jgi:hypothetical protein
MPNLERNLIGALKMKEEHIFNELHKHLCYDELVELNEAKYMADWSDEDELVELVNELN